MEINVEIKERHEMKKKVSLVSGFYFVNSCPIFSVSFLKLSKYSFFELHIIQKGKGKKVCPT